ncbi:MAG: peptidylprolyl isomerase [Gammaproteobacteria bacterium]|nr:peptidylprolyl isomerase [Gammaproteobacteria bacterium]
MSENTNVKIETSMGDIVIELYPDKAPITVENFLTYVKDDFFSETIFHRVIPNFMVQGGGMLADMSQKTTRDAIKIEADNGLSNDRGTLAMARTMIPDSATAQFFINVKDNSFLNHTAPTDQGWGYCVFGKVLDGMDVVDAIVAVATTNKAGHSDVPVETITINKASIID